MSDSSENDEDKSRWEYFKLGVKVGLAGFNGYIIWRVIVPPYFEGDA